MSAVAEILANPAVPIGRKVKVAKKAARGNPKKMAGLLRKYAKVKVDSGTLAMHLKLQGPRRKKGAKRGKRKAAARGFTTSKLTAALKSLGYGKRPKHRRKKKNRPSSGMTSIPKLYDQSGMADSFIGALVGRRVRKHKRVSEVGKKVKHRKTKKATLRGRRFRFAGRGKVLGGVALNPSFLSNPSFNFSLKRIMGDVTEAGTVAVGVAGGVYGAKLMNDYVVSPLMTKFFKKAAGTPPTIWERLGIGIATSIILPEFARMVPGDFGRRLSAGARTGGMLYVIGGLKMPGKANPILPIGQMIGAEVGAYELMPQGANSPVAQNYFDDSSQFDTDGVDAYAQEDSQVSYAVDAGVESSNGY